MGSTPSPPRARARSVRTFPAVRRIFVPSSDADRNLDGARRSTSSARSRAPRAALRRTHGRTAGLRVSAQPALPVQGTALGSGIRGIRRFTVRIRMVLDDGDAALCESLNALKERALIRATERIRPPDGAS